MPKVIMKTQDRRVLSAEIESIRQKLRIREKKENVGKYSDDDILELRNQLNILLGERKNIDEGKALRVRHGGHNKRGAREDVKIARELLYSKHVQDLLLNEPDEEKRSRILHDARVGVLK